MDTQPKILTFDLESAGVNGLKSDLGFIICIGYKWLHEEKAHVLMLDQADLKRFDDKKILTEFSRLFNEADLVVGHYACVAPKTKVLMADFTYKPAGDLTVGDKLLSVDENPRGTGRRRRFTMGAVEYAKIVDAPKLRIELSDGTELDVTKNHPFLIPTGSVNGANWGWRKAEELKVGDVLTRVVPTWEHNQGYEAGYLAAAVDGEGHLSISPGIRLGFAQKDNEMLAQFQQLAKQQGFDFIEYIPKKQHKKYAKVHRLTLRKGIWEAFPFLGETRPPRLMGKLLKNITKLCVSVPLENRTTIKSIRYIGVSSVVNLTTSCRTYIAEGFASHNSVFDRRFIQGRLLINSLPPIPPTKMRDTCFIARSAANFSSNRLKHLAKILGLQQQKMENGWPMSWFKVMTGDMKALNGLARYCKGDVLATEELYLRLLPFDQAHPRVHTDRAKCGSCGKDVQYRGVAYVLGRRYRRFQCKGCGRWGRETVSVKETT